MFNHACAISTNGHHTDIVLKVYGNRILLIVTHFKKFGSLIAINRESSLNHLNSNIFSTKTLFGKDDIETAAAGRYIAEQINVDKPLLLSICLKDYDKDILQAIVNTINQIKPW